MEPKEAGIMLLFLAMFATIGWVVYLAAETSKRQRRMKAQAELHGRLLDKFSSAREVVEFLQTPSGAQFVDSISSDREEPASGILRSTHRGIILVIVAVGCLGLTVPYGWRDNPLLVIGVILFCLGIGFLVSAAVSQRLWRTLGLAQRNGNTQQ
jgi:Flp pilus assembly protein TadB